MHALLVTLALLVSSSDPAREALLERFDAARARLASGDLATLERAVTWLEASARSRGGSEQHADDRTHRPDDRTCVARVMDLFVRDHNGVEYAARAAQRACDDVDADLLVGLIDAYVADHNSLEYATLRAREVSRGLHGVTQPFQAVLLALRADHNGLEFSIQRARAIVVPLTPSGARCVVQTFPIFVRDHNGLEYSLHRAAEICAPN